MDFLAKHNLTKMGMEECIPIFEANGIDFEFLQNKMTPATMACIFQGKLQLLSKFEECYKGYTGQWEIPGTQHIDEYQVFWWRNNLDLVCEKT